MMWTFVGIFILAILVHGRDFYRKYFKTTPEVVPIFYVYKIEKDHYICKQEGEQMFWLQYCPSQIIEEYDRWKSKSEKKMKKEPFFTFTDKIKEAVRITSYHENRTTSGPYTTMGYGWQTPDHLKEESDATKAKIIVDMLSGKYDIEMAKQKAKEEQEELERQRKAEMQLNNRFSSGDYIYQSGMYDKSSNNDQISLKSRTSEILRLTPLLIAADERKDEEAVGLILMEMEAVIR